MCIACCLRALGLCQVLVSLMSWGPDSVFRAHGVRNLTFGTLPLWIFGSGPYLALSVDSDAHVFCR